MNFKAAVVAIALLIVGCSQEQAPIKEQSLRFELPQDLKPEVTARLKASWPKVMAACPGLTKYAVDLSFAGVEDNLEFAPDDAKRIEMKFKVSENPTRVPASYRAFGHTCYFGVSPDGKNLLISKSPCASVCFDSVIASSEYKGLL